jgi:hypothetical protein
MAMATASNHPCLLFVRIQLSSAGHSMISSSSSSSLSRIVLMIRSGGADGGGGRGLLRAVHFYQLIGLRALRVTDDWAELVASSPTASASASAPRLHLQAVTTSNEAAVSTGYSPLLVFQVEASTLDDKVARCVQAGAHLDGPLQFQAHGKVAVLRAPDGHMIGLYEPAE